MAGKIRVATEMTNWQRGANWSADETWIIIRSYSEESVQTMLRGTWVNKHVYEDIAKILKEQHGIEKQSEFVTCQLSPFSYPKEKENK